mmetsp:Transcript_103986/g.293279  ORF Transcript_103986/g.293279 Transcript_103986/m.293279 type:complete len:517 (-) Transcript_103986:140-1690(-)
MAAPSGNIVLHCVVHPSLQFPFKFDAKEHPFTVSPSITINKLMETVEETVERLAQKEDCPIQFQIQVLWNTNDQRKALSPNDIVGARFKTGESFGIYGDLMQIPQAVPQVPEEAKLPVTILTGFLGSGKTTLLNYILQEQKEKKIAVIENEFGEVSIDDALLKQDKLALAEKVVVMDNGCMCCTVRGDLLSGLREILNEVHKGSKLDAILIETTGMADPVPIVRTFMTSQEVSGELRLDGVVTVADAKHIIGRLDDKVEEGKVNEAYQQVAFCDKILLNKLDLVSSDQAIVVKDRLRSINAFAKILPTVKSRVKMGELTDMRAHDMTSFANTDIEKEAVAEDEHGHGKHGAGHGGHDDHGSHGEGHGHGHGHDEATCTEDHGHGGGHESGHSGGHGAAGHGDGHGHGNAAKRSRHDSRVNSMAIVREGEIIPQKLSQWMQMLGQMPESRGTVFRIKAILAVKGHPFKHVFHAVMDVSDEDDAGPWAEGEKKVSKIVFIGKSLDERFLREGFEGIFE